MREQGREPLLTTKEKTTMMVTTMTRIEVMMAMTRVMMARVGDDGDDVGLMAMTMMMTMALVDEDGDADDADAGDGDEGDDDFLRSFRDRARPARGEGRGLR